MTTEKKNQLKEIAGNHPGVFSAFYFSRMLKEHNGTILYWAKKFGLKLRITPRPKKEKESNAKNIFRWKDYSNGII